MAENENKRNEGSDDRRSDGPRRDGDNRSRNDRGDRNQGQQVRKRIYLKKKVCRFCTDKKLRFDYKEVDILRRFTTDGGKIIPKRISGNCSKHQRKLADAIKRARAIALLPYTKKLMNIKKY